MKASASPAEIAIASGACAFSRSAVDAGETSRRIAFEEARPLIIHSQ